MESEAIRWPTPPRFWPTALVARRAGCRTTSARCRNFFKTVIYPHVKDGASANWGTSAMAGIMSMSVFCDDQEMFDHAVDVYKHGFVVNGSLKGGCCSVTQYIDATGENAETGRDQPHSQGGIAHLVETALVAWNQGVDLVSYNDRAGRPRLWRSRRQPALARPRIHRQVQPRQRRAISPVLRVLQ